MKPSYRVLVIDDNPEALTTVNDRLGLITEEGTAEFQIESFANFAEARDALLTRQYDFAVVDLRDDAASSTPDNDAGLVLFENLKAQSFVPVVFHTAYQDDIMFEDRSLPFVRVAPKDHPESLETAVIELIDSGILDMARELYREVGDEVREYLWQQDSSDRIKAVRDDLKVILFRRVAARLDIAGRKDQNDSGVNATRMYLHPPITPGFACGDLILWDNKWWVLATPACDLVIRKAKFNATYLRMVSAEHPSEGAGLKSGKTDAGFFKDAHTGRKPRYLFLPAFLDVPRLVVDFQKLQTVKTEECLKMLEDGTLRRVATLDSPYVEELLVRSSQYSGRIGSPDLAAAAFVDLEDD